MKTNLFLLVVVGAIAIGGIVTLSLLIPYLLAAPVGKVGAEIQIESAEHRIVAYNHFFNLCAGVRVAEVSLDAQYEQLDNTKDSFQRFRIQTNITGLLGHRAQKIEEYNANSRKDYTEAQFRDSNLPYQLSIKEWSKGVRTSCGS